MSHAVSGVKKLAEKIRHKLTATFSNEYGAFDMMSVLVGAAVVAILVGGAMTNAFGVIPWVQNNAATQNLSAVTTAQGVHKAQTTNGASYAVDLAALKTAKLISSDAADLYVAGDTDSWAAIAKSASGSWYKISSKDNAATALGSSPADAAAAQTAVAALNTAIV